MNASSWRKVADLVAQATPANPQVQAAAMAESQQLESLPLSALALFLKKVIRECLDHDFCMSQSAVHFVQSQHYIYI